MNVSKITVSRLFNLGNYENQKIDITVEIADGESAAKAMRGIENVIFSLNPRRPGAMPTEREIKSLEEEISTIETMAENDCCNRYQKSKSVVLHDLKRRLEKKKQQRQEWEIVQLKARNFLDDIGGAETFTDAKKLWDDDYYDEF